MSHMIRYGRPLPLRPTRREISVSNASMYWSISRHCTHSSPEHKTALPQTESSLPQTSMRYVYLHNTSVAYSFIFHSSHVVRCRTLSSPLYRSGRLHTGDRRQSTTRQLSSRVWNGSCVPSRWSACLRRQEQVRRMKLCPAALR